MAKCKRSPGRVLPDVPMYLEKQLLIQQHEDFGRFGTLLLLSDHDLRRAVAVRSLKLTQIYERFIIKIMWMVAKSCAS